MDYKATAAELIEKVGGKENITGLTHCVTRLRFTLSDSSKAKTEAIKDMPGIIGVVENAGQYQVIIGNEVGKVYEQAAEQVNLQKEAALPVNEDAEKISVWKKILDTVVSCFTPAIPVMAGAGMIKVLVTILVALHVLEMGSPTYNVLYLIGDTFFYFLPVFVALNAAKKMKTDAFVAVTLALILVSPNFAALAGETGSSSFLGIGFSVLDYSTQALPAILGVWLLKYVDKFADRISPNMIKLFLRPMIDLLICAPIMFLLIGPVSIVIGNAMFALVSVINNWGWLAVGINAFLFPLMVLTGTHNATIPLLVQTMASQGFDMIFLPSGMAANIAEAGAAAAVALKTKNKGLKSTAGSATLSALLGITEPALYGVNLRMKKPFVSMLIGSFVGGCIVGFFKLTAPTFVTPSLLTAAIFAGHGASVLTSFLAVILTFAETFLITWFIGFDDLPEDK